ncbi:MAG: ATP-binding cassette domain-containing protein [Acutalibacteraceae bacterium]
MLLQINHITKTYNVNSSLNGKQTVLNDISLSLNKGDSIALIGESGCGKSTLK